MGNGQGDELPAMPEKGAAHDLGLQLLQTRAQIKRLQESLKDKKASLAATLHKSELCYIDVEFDGTVYRIEVEQPHEEKITIKKVK